VESLIDKIFLFRALGTLSSDGLPPACSALLDGWVVGQFEIEKVNIQANPRFLESSIGAESRPGPDVAIAKGSLQGFGDILFLGMTETPHFVSLNMLI
jgi:hypothetical protein